MISLYLVNCPTKLSHQFHDKTKTLLSNIFRNQVPMSRHRECLRYNNSMISLLKYLYMAVKFISRGSSYYCYSNWHKISIFFVIVIIIVICLPVTKSRFSFWKFRSMASWRNTDFMSVFCRAENGILD